MRQFLALILTCFLFPAFGGAQPGVAVSANHVADAFERYIPSAKLCFAPVDAASNPVGFRVGTTQILPGEVCGLVANGALASSLSVAPNVADTYYHIYVRERITGAVLRDYGMTSITGSTWSLDTYDPASMAVLPHALTMGTVTTLSPGSSAGCTISGTSPYYLTCGIPKGDTGTAGATGPTGPQGIPGSSAIGSITGLSSDGASGITVSGNVVANKRVPNITKLLCEGDSITAGVNTSGSAARYCNVAMTLPALVGRSITYTNIATSGATIATIAARYATSVKPSCLAGGTLLSLLIGTNNFSNLGDTDTVAFAALQPYVATAQADGCLVSVATILPRTQSSWTATMEGYREAYNTDIRNWAVPDFAPDFDAVIQNSADPSAFSDGLHPGDSAHALMADVFNAALMGTRQLKPMIYAPVTVSPTYPQAAALAPSTDLNTVAECGVYDINGATNGPASLAGGWLHVQVLCNSSNLPTQNYVMQLVTKLQTLTPVMFVRTMQNTTWGAWIQTYPAATTLLDTSTDLNTITAIGQYDGQNLVNGPLGTGWTHLLVLATDAGSGGLASAYTAQIATNVTGTVNHVYYRSENAGTWNAWTELGGTASALSTTGSNGQMWGVAGGVQGWVTPSGLANGSSGQVWSMTSGSTQGWATPTGLPNTLGCLDGFDHYPCPVKAWDSTDRTTDTGTLSFVAPADGIYSVRCYIVLTVAATTSSTMPRCAAQFTDPETSVQDTWAFLDATSALNIVGTSSASTASLGAGGYVFRAKSGSNINVESYGYVSSGATPMQFSFHAKVYYDGP